MVYLACLFSLATKINLIISYTANHKRLLSKFSRKYKLYGLLSLPVEDVVRSSGEGIPLHSDPTELQESTPVNTIIVRKQPRESTSPPPQADDTIAQLNSDTFDGGGAERTTQSVASDQDAAGSEDKPCDAGAEVGRDQEAAEAPASRDQEISDTKGLTTESNSEPSIIARGSVGTGKPVTMGNEPSSDEQNTSGDSNKTTGQDSKKMTHTQRKLILSDSSGADDEHWSPLHQQGSPMSSNYPLMFPPTPPSDLNLGGGGRRLRPRRLSSLFDEAVPGSGSSSVAGTPLLHAKHRSPLHRELSSFVVGSPQMWRGGVMWKGGGSTVNSLRCY